MSTKRNPLPPSLVANLQAALMARANGGEEAQSEVKEEEPAAPEESKPAILVTNADGIDSSGLASLVKGLASDGRFEVNVCAPQFDKSASGHSLTVRETVEVASIEISGATTSYEVSGTPADCVTLALSQALFSWEKPALVISGIHRGASSGLNMLYSGAIAGAREALIHGVPALCISLNWKKDESSENDYKDAVEVCLPLINAVLRDVEKGDFPKGCLLSVEVPVSPSTNKGFKLTRQSLWRSNLSWQAVSSYKRPSAANIMSSQINLGIQLAQLGRDASAAGAARRLNTNKKNVEVESVGVAGKQDSEQAVRKLFRLELVDKECEDDEEDLDFKALDQGFITITPLALSLDNQSEILSSVSNWFSVALPVSPFVLLSYSLNVVFKEQIGKCIGFVCHIKINLLVKIVAVQYLFGPDRTNINVQRAVVRNYEGSRGIEIPLLHPNLQRKIYNVYDNGRKVIMEVNGSSNRRSSSLLN